MRFTFAIRKLHPYGGQERDCVSLAREFMALGHDVRLALEEIPSSDRPMDVAMECVPTSGWTNRQRRYRFDQGARALSDGNASCLIGFGQMLTADFIFCAGMPALEWVSPWKRLLPRYRTLLAREKQLFRASDGPFVFFLNDAQADGYRRSYGTGIDRSSILPTLFRAEAVPPSFYARRDETRRVLGIESGTPLLLHVAINPWLKGLDIALTALSRVDGAVLVSIGSRSSSMQALARRLGVSERVKFLGYLDDVSDLIAASDLVVNPARIEAAGHSITQALLNGVPAVASPQCGYSYHIERSGAGSILSAYDRPDELAAAMTAAIADMPELKAKARDYSMTLRNSGGERRVAEEMLRIVSTRWNSRPASSDRHPS